jgi:hypothetical protein
MKNQPESEMAAKLSAMTPKERKRFLLKNMEEEIAVLQHMTRYNKQSVTGRTVTLLAVMIFYLKEEEK